MSEEHEVWIRCYECRRNGNNYYLDGEGNWVCACPDCPNKEAYIYD